MKKLILCSAMSLSVLITSGGVHASATEAKQGALFGGAATLGAIAGGPIGFVAGATIGALIGEDIKRGDIAQKQTQISANKINALQETLAMNEIMMSESLESTEKLTSLIQNLPSEVYFESSSDQLTQDGRAIIEVLAEIIKNDSQATIELVGHTDPRGTDEFNNVLSQYRALAVEDQFIELGVSPNQIISRGEGSNFSTAPKGDTENYAFERRVDIVIHSEESVAYQFSD